MTCAPRRQAARCIAAFGAFVLLAAALLGPADAHGQRPVRRPPIPPPDTVARPDTLVRRDTTAVEPRDSVAAAVPDSASPAVPAPAAPDTTPIPQLPRLYAEAARDGEAGVWTWDQTALLASGALTLTDLLERIPGVTGVRYGFVGLPETVASLGSAGNIELVLDGYVIDPLGAAALDLSRIELAELGHVRVERRARRAARGGGVPQPALQRAVLPHRSGDRLLQDQPAARPVPDPAFPRRLGRARGRAAGVRGVRRADGELQRLGAVDPDGKQARAPGRVPPRLDQPAGRGVRPLLRPA